MPRVSQLMSKGGFSLCSIDYQFASINVGGINLNIPKPLLNDIAAGKCLPFIGAGFSLNCKAPPGVELPDWKGLVKILAEESGIDSTLAPPKIASLYEHHFGRVQLIETVRRSLHLDEIEPGSLHHIFASLSFDTIYTTNYDLLLESAYQNINKPYRSLVGECQMPFHGGILSTNIIKMHGDLRHEEHIIITEEDFNQYITNYPVVATHLSAMLITRTGLYLGYSHSDPNFQHIRDIVRSRLGKFERMAYIVQFDLRPQDAEEMFKINLHPINLITNGKKSKTDLLIDFFQTVQRHIETQESIKIRELRPEAFEPLKKGILAKSLRMEDSTALLTSSSNLCFVITPFKPGYEMVFQQIIKPSAIEFGLEVLRADNIYSPGIITNQIRAAIHQSKICIADITGRNLNVMYEVGIAHTLDKPTILLSQNIEKIPFDLRVFRVIYYSLDARRIEDAKVHLKTAIHEILGRNRLVEAEQLLDRGNTRAAVVEASIYLENSLREFLRRNEDKNIKQIMECKDKRLSLRKMLDVLNKSKLISNEEYNDLKQCITIRNRTVHELEEIKKTDAIFLIKIANKFIDSYLGKDF